MLKAGQGFVHRYKPSVGVGERRNPRVLQTTSVMLGMIAGIPTTCCHISAMVCRVNAYLQRKLCGQTGVEIRSVENNGLQAG